MTMKHPIKPNVARSLEDGFDTFLIALGTKIMRGFVALARRANAIHQSSGSQLVQLVTFLFLRPVFLGNQFGFQLLNFGCRRKVRRLCLDELRLRFPNDSEQLLRFRVHGHPLFQLQNSFDSLAEGIKLLANRAH